MKRSVVILLSLLLSVLIPYTIIHSGASIQPTAVIGDTPATAISINPVDYTNITRVTNTFPGDSANGGYWFVVELGQNLLSGSYTFEAVYQELNFLAFAVYDASLSFIDGSIQQTLTPRSFRDSNDLLGIYYIEVFPLSGNIGDFEFTAIFTSLDGDAEYNNMAVFSDTITPGIMPNPTTNGSTWYRIDFVSSDFDTLFSLDADTSTNFDIFVYTYDLIPLGSSETISYPDQLQTIGPGPILIEIRPISGSGNFNLAIELLIPAGYDKDHAIPMFLNQSISGEFPNSDGLTSLNYAIDFGPNPASYRLTLTGDAGSDYDAEVRNNESRFVASTSTSSYPKTADIIAASGINNIFISGYANIGNFSLVIEPFDPEGSLNNPIEIQLWQPIFESMPGTANDGSYYYSINLNASVYIFSLTVFNYLSSTNLQTSQVVDIATITIFDESGTIIDSVGANPTATITEPLITGTYLINIASDNSDILFDLDVFEILPGRFDNPYIAENYQHTGTFENGFSEWVVFIPPVGEDLVTFSLSCSGSTFMSLSAYHPNQTEIIDGGLSECSQTSTPTISVTNPPEEIYVLVSTEYTVPFTLEMDCDTCVDEILHNPMLAWTVEGLELTERGNTICGVSYLITADFAWTDYPQTSISVKFEYEISTVDSLGNPVVITEELRTGGFNAVGNGNDFETAHFFPQGSGDALIIITANIGGVEEEKFLDWVANCELTTTSSTTSTPTDSSADTSSTPTTTTDPVTTSSTSTSRNGSIPFNMVYFLISGSVLILIYKKKN